jgi:hypothetical protein
MTPLEIFVARWQEAIPTSAITYYEVVNTQVDLNDAPEPWGTAVVQSESRADVTMGSNPWVDETGFFAIALVTRSGSGPATLNQAVDYIRQTFHGYRKDGLWITQVDGPHDTDPDGLGEWWQLFMTARFTFQTRRDATGPGYGDWQGFPDVPPAPLPGP